MAPIVKADVKNLGQYKAITRATHPHLFRDPATLDQSAKNARAALEALIRRTTGEEELEEDYNEDARSTPVSDTNTVNDQQIADALDVNDGPWKRNKPRTQPLTYAIPTDVNGGKVFRTIKFDADFNNQDSVERANKCRRQGLLRAAKKLGLRLKRASTHDKQYTVVNNNWIYARYDTYAANNNGYRIPLKDLVAEYQERFWADNRSYGSIASHIDRVDWLKAKKNSYPPAP